MFKGGKANEKDERVSKMTTVALGVVAIVLGILFEKQNIAFMVGLAFSIAASCNFPVLLLSMYWKKLTTRGAMIGGWMGLITAVGLMVLGPTICANPRPRESHLPVRVPGAVLDDRRLRRYLVLLHHRQVGGGRRGAGALLPAVHPFPDRPGRLWRGGTKRYVKTAEAPDFRSAAFRFSVPVTAR